MSICRSIYLSIDRSVSLSSHPSFDLSLDVFMDLAMHRSVYLSIDLFTRLSIDLAIKSHCTYPLLCFKNRCLQELPLHDFPSSAYGCTIRVGDKTDAKCRRYTDGSEKTPSFQSSVPTTTGNNKNKVTCCRLGSAARKDTRSIESRASKTDLSPYVSIYASIHPSSSLSTCPSIYLLTCRSICLTATSTTKQCC